MIFWNKITKKIELIKAAELSFIWFPVLLVTLANQHQFMFKNIFVPAARTAGYSHERELTIPDLIYFFQNTIIEFIFILPLILLLLCTFLYGRILKYIILLSALFVLIINFVNLLTIANIGNFISFPLIHTTMEWGLDNPRMIDDYVSLSSFLKIISLFFLILLMHYTSTLKKGVIRNIYKYTAVTYILISMAAGTVLISYAQTSRVKGLAPNQSFLISQYHGLIEKHESIADIEELSDNPKILFQDFRKKTNSNLSSQNQKFIGKEKDNNILFFIFETGPNLVTIDYLNKNLFENFNILKKKAFFSENHYSTYPFTSSALFSILGSLYPDKIRREMISDNILMNNIGLLNILKKHGYQTNIYSINDLGSESDKVLFERLGASSQYYSYEDENVRAISNDSISIDGLSNLNNVAKEATQKIYKYDVASLHKLLKDIKYAHRKNQKFASVFLPQLGHGPWVKLSSSNSFFDNGAYLFDLQDKWLGEIIDTLKELKILDETIIIVTSDHGLRTTVEYPQLKSSYLDGASYNVPLLIYAPNTLEKTYAIQPVTSHIDIMPTILSLIGLSWNNSCILGSPVWDNNLKKRITYFNGKDYSGNTGYSQDGKFISYNYLQRNFYLNDEMNFSSENIILNDTNKFAYKIEYQQAFEKKILQLIGKNKFCNSV